MVYRAKLNGRAQLELLRTHKPFVEADAREPHRF
jgi:hypothetical protein